MSGVDLITEERQRQISVEGWTPEHDDTHEAGELAFAACCYAAPLPLYKRDQFKGGMSFRDPWPWEAAFDKRRYDKFGRLATPTHAERLKLLVKAGALIAAEIDRLERSRDHNRELSA